MTRGLPTGLQRYKDQRDERTRKQCLTSAGDEEYSRNSWSSQDVPDPDRHLFCCVLGLKAKEDTLHMPKPIHSFRIQKVSGSRHDRVIGIEGDSTKQFGCHDPSCFRVRMNIPTWKLVCLPFYFALIWTIHSRS